MLKWTQILCFSVFWTISRTNLDFPPYLGPEDLYFFLKYSKDVPQEWRSFVTVKDETGLVEMKLLESKSHSFRVMFPENSPPAMEVCFPECNLGIIVFCYPSKEADLSGKCDQQSAGFFLHKNGSTYHLYYDMVDLPHGRTLTREGSTCLGVKFLSHKVNITDEDHVLGYPRIPSWRWVDSSANLNMKEAVFKVKADCKAVLKTTGLIVVEGASMMTTDNPFIRVKTGEFLQFIGISVTIGFVLSAVVLGIIYWLNWYRNKKRAEQEAAIQKIVHASDKSNKARYDVRAPRPPESTAQKAVIGGIVDKNKAEKRDQNGGPSADPAIKKPSVETAKKPSIKKES
uniref:Uncharacterized protein n=1 Tax=Panagrolaimus sp. JU765 TaxID=591449 RepID=A0AC34R9K8_9BILA